MKTLRDELLALAPLLEIDARIAKDKGTIGQLDTGAAIAAEYNGKKPAADALRSAANKAAAEQRDAELKLASIEEKASQVQKTLYGGTVRAPRELENLQKEVEMLARQKDAGEEAVLLAMDAAGEAEAAAKTAEAELTALAERYRKTRAIYQKRHAELTADIESLAAPRAAALAGVTDAELLRRYDAVRAKKNGIGAALVSDDNRCGACHTGVSAHIADAVRDGKAIAACESCTRILIPTPKA